MATACICLTTFGPTLWIEAHDLLVRSAGLGACGLLAALLTPTPAVEPPSQRVSLADQAHAWCAGERPPLIA